MRIRDRDTTALEPVTFTRLGYTVAPDTGYSKCGGVLWKDPGIFPAYTPSEFAGYTGKVGVKSHIEDVGGPRVPNSLNAVTHEKWDYQFPLRQVSYQGEATESPYYRLCRETNEGGISAGWNTAEALGRLNAPSWDTDTNALIRATGALNFGIQNAAVHIPTFLGEMRDFATLFQLTFGGLGTKATKVRTAADRGRFTSLLTRLVTGKASMTEVFRAVATIDLGYQWAIKPFLNDLKKLTEVGKHVASQYSRLQRTLPQTIHASVFDRGTEYSDLSNSYHKTDVNVFKTRLVTATSIFRYMVDELPTPPNILADAVGMDDLHVAAWELTRFSFAVDYFINIGDWLNQFHGNLIDLPYEILDECASVKMEAEVDVSTAFDAYGIRVAHWNQGGTRTVKGKMIHTRYQRTTGDLPHGAVSIVPQVRLPSLRQALNLSELTYLFTTVNHHATR
jgi:hypothetical protein